MLREGMSPSRLGSLCRLALMIAMLFGVPACRKPVRLNLLLITASGLSPDAILRQAPGGQLPNIDRLAREGTFFANAFTDTPSTAASLASVMTGTGVRTHKVRLNQRDRLPDLALTLAEVMRDHGYTTAAVVSAPELAARYGFAQGFAQYHEPPAHTPWNDSKVTSTAITWLRTAPVTPFFLWVQYSGFRNTDEIADPLDGPPISGEEKERRSASLRARKTPPRTGRATRKKSAPLSRISVAAGPQTSPSPRTLARVDAEVGRLLAELQALGLRRTTLIVLHSDHSAPRHDSSGFDYDRLDDGALRVALLFQHWWHIPKERRAERIVRNTDIFPTVLAAVGVPPWKEYELEGESLMPLIHYGAGKNVREIYLEANGADVVRRGIRTSRWKYIRTEPAARDENPRPGERSAAANGAAEELLDLFADPGESHNVASAYLDLVAHFRARLAQLSTPEPTPAPREMQEWNREDALKSGGSS